MALTKVTGQVVNTSTDLTVGVLTATTASFTGNVSVGGTLTYEDVTNVDSVGLITARNGISVTGSNISVESSEDRLLYLKSTDANAYLTFEDTDSSSGFANRIGSVSDGLYFSTGGGGERARIDSSGRLLLGTTTEGNSGADDLTIATSGNSGITIRSGTSDYGNIYYSDATSGTGEYAGYVSYQHSTNSLQFATASTERLRIKSDGKVGIGTNNPLDELHVNSSSANVNLRLTRDVDNGARITGSDGASPAFIVETIASGTATERMRIDSSGDIGIGINSPASILHIKKNSSNTSPTSHNYPATQSGLLVDNQNTGTNGTFSAVSLRAYNSGSTAQSASIIAQSTSSGFSPSLLFTQRSGSGTQAERMRIDSSGRLLIGRTSTSHGHSLQVQADSGANAIAIQGRSVDDQSEITFYENDNSTILGQIQHLTTHSTYRHRAGYIRFDSGGYNEKMRLDSSGRLLVGTQSALDTTTGSIASNNSANGGRLALGGNPSSAGASIGEIFGWWNGNKVGGLVIASGADTTNKDDGELLFYTSASGPSVVERMRIDRIGNVGIGEDSPAHELHVSDASTPEIVVEDTTNNCKAYLGSSDSNGRVGTLSNHDLAFRTNDTERMRINSSGKIKMGGTTDTTSNLLTLRGNWGYGVGGGVLFRHDPSIPGGGRADVIYFNYQGTNVGEIDIDTNDTAYRTTSDYRLKENQVNISDGIDRVKQLSPYRFNWISTPAKTVDGFFAHEVQTVVPEAVSGSHNAVDDDNNPVYQGIDQAKLVPLLTAALQEAIAKIETLETKVAALEG